MRLSVFVRRLFTPINNLLLPDMRLIPYMPRCRYYGSTLGAINVPRVSTICHLVSRALWSYQGAYRAGGTYPFGSLSPADTSTVARTRHDASAFEELNG